MRRRCFIGKRLSGRFARLLAFLPACLSACLPVSFLIATERAHGRLDSQPASQRVGRSLAFSLGRQAGRQADKEMATRHESPRLESCADEVPYCLRASDHLATARQRERHREIISVFSASPLSGLYHGVLLLIIGAPRRAVPSSKLRCSFLIPWSDASLLSSPIGLPLATLLLGHCE